MADEKKSSNEVANEGMSDTTAPSPTKRYGTKIDTCIQCGRSMEMSVSAYEMANARSSLLSFTPTSIWREYEDEGYSLIEAIAMEFSYA